MIFKIHIMMHVTLCTHMFSLQTLRLIKNIIRGGEKDHLHKVNRDECELLIDRWTSEECATAIMNFFSRSKL